MKRVFLLSILIGLHTSGFGQAFDTTPNAQTGRQSFGSYFDSDIDSINLYNGNLSLNIKLFDRPGRELSTGLRLSYNSQKWQQSSCLIFNCGIYTGGWTNSDVIGEMPAYAQETFNCAGSSNHQFILYVTWIDGLGTKHRYYRSDESCLNAYPVFENYSYLSADGDSSRLIVGATPNDIRIEFKDGHVLDFGHTTADPIYGRPAIITPNGNFLFRADDGTLSPDTVSRSIVFSTNFVETTQQNYEYYRRYEVKDQAGTSRAYTLNFRTNVMVLNPWDSQQQHSNVYSPITILRSIDLPDGTAYIFAYDHPQGFLTQVTLPTGGYMKYLYPALSGLPGSDYVIERRVSYDGVNEQSWTYTRGVNSSCAGSSRELTVMSPVSDQREVHCFNSVGLETTTLWQELIGPTWATKKTVATDWTDSGQSTGQPANPRRRLITTTLGNVSRKTAIHYDNDNDLNVDCVREGDWSASAYTLPNDNCVPVAATGLIAQRNFAYTAHALAIYPWQRLAAENLFGINPETGSFEQQGATEFLYNETALTARSGVPNNLQSLAVPLAACTQQSCSPRVLTTIRRYTSATTSVDEKFTYDAVGNVLTDTDPLNHTTTIEYADNFQGSSNLNSFAYPTRQTDAAGHVTHAKYEYNTGLVVEGRDARDLKTGFTYDLFNRIKTRTQPNGQVTTYDYDNVTPKVTEYAQMAATGEKRQTETQFDKFYRVKKTTELDPVAGNVITETQYDAMGRPNQVSEPYRTGTPVWTTTDYDVLNRPKKVTHPDATFLTYAYSGNKVTTTDEAGVQRTLTSNALGQMTQVEDRTESHAFDAADHELYLLPVRTAAASQPIGIDAHLHARLAGPQEKRNASGIRTDHLRAGRSRSHANAHRCAGNRHDVWIRCDRPGHLDHVFRYDADGHLRLRSKRICGISHDGFRRERHDERLYVYDRRTTGLRAGDIDECSGHFHDELRI
jgi:YD repeat-containing protein